MDNLDRIAICRSWGRVSSITWPATWTAVLYYRPQNFICKKAAAGNGALAKAYCAQKRRLTIHVKNFLSVYGQPCHAASWHSQDILKIAGHGLACKSWPCSMTCQGISCDSRIGMLYAWCWTSHNDKATDAYQGCSDCCIWGYCPALYGLCMYWDPQKTCTTVLMHAPLLFECILSIRVILVLEALKTIKSYCLLRINAKYLDTMKLKYLDTMKLLHGISLTAVYKLTGLRGNGNHIHDSKTLQEDVWNGIGWDDGMGSAFLLLCQHGSFNKATMLKRNWASQSGVHLNEMTWVESLSWPERLVHLCWQLTVRRYSAQLSTCLPFLDLLLGSFHPSYRPLNLTLPDLD